MSTPLARARIRVRAVVATVVVAALASTLGWVAPAAAATSTDLLYSTDGTTWSSSVTLAPGQAFVVRQWFDNDDPLPVDDASIETELPPGFLPGLWSTSVCLSPNTTDPASPDPTDQRCSASANSVWSGSILSVAPSAGHYGVPVTATSGLLAAGRYAYLNLHQGNVDHPCPTQAGSAAGFIPLPFVGLPRLSSGLDASNDVPPGPTSGMAGCGNFNFPATGVQSLSLLGNRSIDLYECHWTYPDGRSVDAVVNSSWSQSDPAWVTGTHMTQESNSAPSCGIGGAGSTYQPATSGILTLDIQSGRYLRIAQCRWQTTSSPTTWLTSIIHNDPSAPELGTLTTATAPDTSSYACANPDPANLVADTTSGATFQGAAAVDLWDVTRARGYVNYLAIAPAEPTAEDCLANLPPYTQEGRLVTPGGTDTSTGTITVDWTQLGTEPCPADGGPFLDPEVAGASVGLLAAAAVVAARRPRRFRR